MASERAREVAQQLTDDWRAAEWVGTLMEWLPDALDRYAQEREAAAYQRLIKALCPHCEPKHVLDNGRLWGGCGGWYLVDRNAYSLPENEVAAAVAALPTLDPK